MLNSVAYAGLLNNLALGGRLPYFHGLRMVCVVTIFEAFAKLLRLDYHDVTFMRGALWSNVQSAMINN